MDGIVVHIRGESDRVSKHTMYVAPGVDWEGRKELLGLWLNETEGAKFWLSCLTDRKNRGVNDIFIVCVDGLSGFPEAIQTAFPQASFHPRLASASMTERRDDSLRQRVFLAIREASKKWTKPIPKWKDALNHFAILFEDRLPKHLN